MSPAGEIVGAHGAENRAAGVLCEHEARELHGRAGRGQPDGRAIRNARAVHGDRAAGGERNALRAARAEGGVERAELLFLEEHITRVGPQQFVHALWVLHGPGGDAGPGGVAHEALIEQPFADALVRLVVGSGEGQTRHAHRAVGLLHADAARALDVQHHGFDGITHPCEHLALQGGLRGGQRVDLLAGVPGLAHAEVCGRRIQRHVEAVAGRA